MSWRVMPERRLSFLFARRIASSMCFREEMSFIEMRMAGKFWNRIRFPMHSTQIRRPVAVMAR